MNSPLISPSRGLLVGYTGIGEEGEKSHRWIDFVAGTM